MNFSICRAINNVKTISILRCNWTKTLGEWLPEIPDCQNINSTIMNINVLYEFLVTVKAAPYECVIWTGQPWT